MKLKIRKRRFVLTLLCITAIGYSAMVAVMHNSPVILVLMGCVATVVILALNQHGQL